MTVKEFFHGMLHGIGCFMARLWATEWLEKKSIHGLACWTFFSKR